MNDKQKISSSMLAVGMLLLVMMAIMPLLGMNYAWVKYVFALGALLTLIARIIDRYKGKSITLQRLYRIQSVSSLLYCVSAAMLFPALRSYVQEKDWLAFLTAGVVLQVYSMYRIQAVEKKENDKK